MKYKFDNFWNSLNFLNTVCTNSEHSSSTGLVVHLTVPGNTFPNRKLTSQKYTR